MTTTNPDKRPYFVALPKDGRCIVRRPSEWLIEQRPDLGLLAILYAVYGAPVFVFYCDRGLTEEQLRELLEGQDDVRAV